MTTPTPDVTTPTPARLARVIPAAGGERSVELLRDVSRDVAAATVPRRAVGGRRAMRALGSATEAPRSGADRTRGGLATAVPGDEPWPTICPQCGQIVTPGWTYVCSRCRMPLAQTRDLSPQ